MHALTDQGRQIVDDTARQHGFSPDAVETLLRALAAGGGNQAQFTHWELGGMGQWSQGGMIMIGDMFNQGLKYRVDALCTELSAALRTSQLFAWPSTAPQGTSFSTPFASRWPQELGMPSSTGSQNDLHYAVFPTTHSLAIDHGGHVTVYDTADHVISGFSQQQGGGQSITFTSQYGLIGVADLRQVSPVTPQPNALAAEMRPPAPGVSSDEEIFSRIERLAELRKRDILTEEEFSSKKAELLARL